jgi:hypothetical protein
MTSAWCVGDLVRCVGGSHLTERFGMKLDLIFSSGLLGTACRCTFGAVLVGLHDDLTHRIQTRLPLCLRAVEAVK